VQDLVDRTIDAHDALGAAGRELTERCAAAADGAGRVRAAAAWVRTRLRAAPPMDPAVRWLVEAIEASAGGIAIADLRARAGLAKSRVTARFRDQVGVTPKLYARLLRFRGALEALDRWDEARPLTDLALDAGYYDQAHFNGEFREFAELSPGAFRDAVRYPRSVSVVEG
jgi:AraC-like DNA-binding protein